MASKKQQILRTLTQDDRLLGLLLTPSWVSAIFGVLVSLGVTVGSLATLAYNGSSWQYLVHLQEEKSRTVAMSYQSIDSGLSASVIISNIPLFIFWAGVGLIVYSFANGIVNALRNVVVLHDELDYVNVDRHMLIRDALERLLLRIIAFIVWIFFIQFTLHTLVPYIAALAYVALGLDNIFMAGLYVLAGIAVGLIVFHAHTILIRLLFIRPRLFSNLN